MMPFSGAMPASSLFAKIAGCLLASSMGLIGWVLRDDMQSIDRNSRDIAALKQADIGMLEQRSELIHKRDRENDDIKASLAEIRTDLRELRKDLKR